MPSLGDWPGLLGLPHLRPDAVSQIPGGGWKEEITLLNQSRGQAQTPSRPLKASSLPE